MTDQQGTLFASECPHDIAEEIILHSGPHYGKQVCHKCRKFLRWVPKPETIERREEDKAILTALAKLKLPEWERCFVRELACSKNLSPRQREKLLSLRDIHLGKDFSP
jgi:hypothetical protein